METKSKESYLLFKLQDELFAVSVHKVLEIIETGEEHTITALPKAPEAISGVVNFRGNVIPVVNTRLKFDLVDYSENEKFVVIVLSLNFNNQDNIIGAQSDKVVDVIEISEEEIKPVPEVGQSYNSNYIHGVIHRNGKFIMLINLEEVMASREIIELQKIASEVKETLEP
ncbi:chemotaxis protein CheW [Plebeiibacterium marinum]|uniref:Chemotaxis protein CheW n=1 Tax=Plebeiibacterium marinum TaxID=2992111 RepID=A0AAE3SIZ3_9BACT|nr:chemotaxis protein CheW [Plebeiobacterium marinum]MCW3805220.1 chemotaxis protein CheW [Plebeiobacterium marinum]